MNFSPASDFPVALKFSIRIIGPWRYTDREKFPEFSGIFQFFSFLLFCAFYQKQFYIIFFSQICLFWVFVFVCLLFKPTRSFLAIVVFLFTTFSSHHTSLMHSVITSLLTFTHASILLVVFFPALTLVHIFFCLSFLSQYVLNFFLVHI